MSIHDEHKFADNLCAYCIGRFDGRRDEQERIRTGVTGLPAHGRVAYQLAVAKNKVLAVIDDLKG